LRVLLLVHRFPFPPDKGDKIRAWHVLEALAREHEVEMVTHVDDPADLRHLDAVRGRVARMHASFLPPFSRRCRAALRFLAGEALSFAWFEHPDARRAVAEAIRLRRPDVIVAVSAQPLGYVFDLPEAAGIPGGRRSRRRRFREVGRLLAVDGLGRRRGVSSALHGR
jgi:hypothetical protein